MRLAVLGLWGVLALVACSSSSKNAVTVVDGGAGNAGAGGSAGAGGGAGAVGKWPDSATTNCSDGVSSNVGCPGNGAEYYGQDGNFEINVPTYKLDGAELTDSVTGFVWRAGTGDATQSDAATGCQSFGAAWRLPSFLELASLVDHGSSGNPVPSVIKSGATSLWTSSSAPIAGSSWVFSSDTGLPRIEGSTLSMGSVCVSGQAIAGELGAPDNGVVHDTRTGLIWQFGTVTNRTWGEALLYCLKAQGGGLVTGWRLPTVKELLTIAKTDSVVAIDTNTFNTPNTVWSSTPVVDDGSTAWTVSFSPLKVTAEALATQAEVRCVHDPS